MAKVSKKQQAINTVTDYVESTLKKDYIKMLSAGGKVMCETIIGLIDNEGYTLEDVKKFCEINLRVDDELYTGKESD